MSLAERPECDTNFLLHFVSVSGSAESKPAEEPEIILEVPEAVTVETEEVHPLPEVIIIILNL